MSETLKKTAGALWRIGPLPLIAVGLISNTLLVNLVEDRNGLLYSVTIIGAFGLFFGLLWAMLRIQFRFLSGLTKPLRLVLRGRLRLGEALATYPECAVWLSGAIALTTGISLTPSLLFAEEYAGLVGMLVLFGLAQIAAGLFMWLRSSKRLPSPPHDETNPLRLKEQGALSGLTGDL